MVLDLGKSLAHYRHDVQISGRCCPSWIFYAFDQLGFSTCKMYWQTWNPGNAPAFIAQANQTRRKLGAILLRQHHVNNLVKWRIGMAVESSVRGQGIGRLLLNRAIEFANASDIKLVTLFVDPLNEPALKLYRGYGFIEIGMVGSLIQMDYGS